MKMLTDDMQVINLMNIPTTIPTNSTYWKNYPKADNFYAAPYTGILQEDADQHRADRRELINEPAERGPSPSPAASSTRGSWDQLMGVLQYIAKRPGLYVAVLFIGLSITFLLPRLMPTNPIDGYIAQLQARAGGVLTTEAIEDLRGSLEELYGLKGDLFSQYVGYLKRIVTSFDFGPSFVPYPQPVNVMDHERAAVDAEPAAGVDADRLAAWQPGRARRRVFPHPARRNHPRGQRDPALPDPILHPMAWAS